LLPVQRRGVGGGRLGVPVFFGFWLNEWFPSGFCPFFYRILLNSGQRTKNLGRNYLTIFFTKNNKICNF
jgi:hypothetical protein